MRIDREIEIIQEKISYIADSSQGAGGGKS
jgi:hypothetical protein